MPQNNLGELFALLKFLWPDVMAKESEAVKKSPRVLLVTHGIHGGGDEVSVKKGFLYYTWFNDV